MQLLDLLPEGAWGLAGVIVGAVATHIGARYQRKRNYTKYERRRLLKYRTHAFETLWTITGGAPRNPDLNNLADGFELSLIDKMDTWYFTQGGLYLTPRCRAAYFHLIEELRLYSVSNKDVVDYQKVYIAASRLRETIVFELGARRPNAKLKEA
ncbi:MAG: hypothetical protein FWD65_04970 [Coriobacteriia bacterium]|nr:hypothetical protein [Coriobacteriia bacterium]